MRKKLLFVIPSFKIGGTTVSTRNLISVLDKAKYDIRVWALDNHGLLKDQYEDVEQVKTSFVAQALALSGWREERNWLRRLAAAVIRMTKRIPCLYRLVMKYVIRRTLGNEAYDTVIACEEGLTSELVSLIPASNRIAWVRCDYKKYFESYGRRKEYFYKAYRHIVCVSEQTTKNFVDVYPEWADRVVCIYNPQDSGLIIANAGNDDHDTRFKTDKTVILSMGRLGSVKRFTHIPSIARQLKEKGLDFVWYIVGDGKEKAAIENNINQNGMEDCVIMLGAKSNPHFYIKRADLYVCLSSSEACPRVVNEAKILGTPVVSTVFPTIYEYLEDGVNGRIVPLERMADAIAEMLSDKEMYNRIKQEIEGFEFDNSGLIKQLEEIL